jgi:hypothetical protein
VAGAPPPVALTPADPTLPALNLPAYQPWPPEAASSRIALDQLIGARDGLSLYRSAELLREALTEAGYGQHSFYSVPGGYILVTQTERTDPQGRGLTGMQRYQKPGEDRRDSLWLRIRDLFLERPETYYRYLAIVVSDQPFGASDGELTTDEAAKRTARGYNDLTDEARSMAFGERYRVTALIYEYINDGIGYDLAMIAPGRLPPKEHLVMSGLQDTVPRAFDNAGSRLN